MSNFWYDDKWVKKKMFRIEGNDANIEEYWSEREKIQIAQMKIKMLSYLKPARYLVIRKYMIIFTDAIGEAEARILDTLYTIYVD